MTTINTTLAAAALSGSRRLCCAETGLTQGSTTSAVQTVTVGSGATQEIVQAFAESSLSAQLQIVGPSLAFYHAAGEAVVLTAT